MITLDGTVQLPDVRPDMKRLSDAFDNLEAVIYAATLTPCNWDAVRGEILTIRKRTFEVIAKTGKTTA